MRDEVGPCGICCLQIRSGIRTGRPLDRPAKGCLYLAQGRAKPALGRIAAAHPLRRLPPKFRFDALHRLSRHRSGGVILDSTRFCRIVSNCLAGPSPNSGTIVRSLSISALNVLSKSTRLILSSAASYPVRSSIQLRRRLRVMLNQGRPPAR